MMKQIYMAVACLALVGCQTTSGGGSLEEQYSIAISCIQNEVDEKLSSSKENEEQIRSFVYAGLRACNPQLTQYVGSVYDQTMFDNSWSSLKPAAKENIASNILVTTSLALQKFYNDKEARQ